MYTGTMGRGRIAERKGRTEWRKEDGKNGGWQRNSPNDNI